MLNGMGDKGHSLLGFRLISELLSDSDCDIRCEGYGCDRHTSVFLVFLFE